MKVSGSIFQDCEFRFDNADDEFASAGVAAFVRGFAVAEANSWNGVAVHRSGESSVRLHSGIFRPSYLLKKETAAVYYNVWQPVAEWRGEGREGGGLAP